MIDEAAANRFLALGRMLMDSGDITPQGLWMLNRVVDDERAAQEEAAMLEHSDERLANVHSAGSCYGEHCTIHNRSDHPMRSFPQHWREDRKLMERICPHGYGHPDPDSPIPEGHTDWVHGCDGCCGDARAGERDEQMVLLYECARCCAVKTLDEVEQLESGGVVRFVCLDCIAPEEAANAVARLSDEMGLYDREEEQR